jgi:uracil-DNA glycosylase family 4
MKEIGNLGGEMLEHLRFYRDLGVRLAAKAPGSIGRDVAAAAAGKPEAPADARKPRPPCTVPASSLFDAAPAAAEDLGTIRADLGECRRCKLCQTRTNIVFGMGDANAELMFVGEAPGADEDEQGLPFVGRAGQLLTKIIQAIDMRREQVYICNILKCRPPQNRNPESDEIAACQPFLFRQIAAVRPRVICALGTFGAQTLLRTKEPISRLRGKFIDFHGTKLMATFHPAYLLRNPNEKRKVWEDVQKIRDYLRSFRP